MIKRIVCIIIASILAVTTAFTSFAGRNKEQVLDFTETENIVHNYNPSIRSAWDSFNLMTVDKFKEYGEEAGEWIDSVEDEKKQMAGISPEIDEMYEQLLSGLKSYKKQMDNSYKSFTRKNSESTLALRQGEGQLVAVVQQLIILYKTVEANQKLLSSLLDLYEGSLNAAKKSQSLGQGTSLDVLSAENQLLATRVQKESLDHNQQQLYQQLIVLCGWDANEQPVIADLPSLDMTVIDSYNPEVDIVQAINNNSNLKSLRNADYKESRKKDRAAFLAEKNAELEIDLNMAYDEVIAAQQSYLGADAAYQAAAINKENAERQKKLGLISDVQYTGLMVTYYQAESAYKTAELSLRQKMLDYEGKVAGR